MPQKYLGKRDKIQDLINKILNKAEFQDLLYYEVVDFIAFETRTDKNKVKEILELSMKMKGFDLIDNNIITISNEKIPEFIQKLRANEEKIKQLDKEMQNIENITKEKQQK
jgi:hypothetical protein